MLRAEQGLESHDFELLPWPVLYLAVSPSGLDDNKSGLQDGSPQEPPSSQKYKVVLFRCDRSESSRHEHAIGAITPELNSRI